jgi:hypothetical protein
MQKFAKYCETVIQSNVFVKDFHSVSTASNAKSTEAYKVQQIALSGQFQHSGSSCHILSLVLNNRELFQECLALQEHLQCQELATIQGKAREADEKIFG